MAKNATNRKPGPVGRAIHHLIPSRRQAAVMVAIELPLTPSGLPVGAHLALAAALHVVIASLRRLQRAKPETLRFWA